MALTSRIRSIRVPLIGATYILESAVKWFSSVGTGEVGEALHAPRLAKCITNVYFHGPTASCSDARTNEPNLWGGFLRKRARSCGHRRSVPDSGVAAAMVIQESASRIRPDS
jgi:hypothetical protein